MLKKSYPETGGKNGAKSERIFLCARAGTHKPRSFRMFSYSNLDTDRSGTVSDLYLSTPDELEGDNMHVRKLKSRLIAFGINWDVYDK